MPMPRLCLIFAGQAQPWGVRSAECWCLPRWLQPRVQLRRGRQLRHRGLGSLRKEGNQMLLQCSGQGCSATGYDYVSWWPGLLL